MPVIVNSGCRRGVSASATTNNGGKRGVVGVTVVTREIDFGVVHEKDDCLLHEEEVVGIKEV